MATAIASRSGSQGDSDRYYEDNDGGGGSGGEQSLERTIGLDGKARSSPPPLQAPKSPKSPQGSNHGGSPKAAARYEEFKEGIDVSEYRRQEKAEKKRREKANKAREAARIKQQEEERMAAVATLHNHRAAYTYVHQQRRNGTARLPDDSLYHQGHRDLLRATRDKNMVFHGTWRRLADQLHDDAELLNPAFIEFKQADYAHKGRHKALPLCLSLFYGHPLHFVNPVSPMPPIPPIPQISAMSAGKIQMHKTQVLFDRICTRADVKHLSHVEFNRFWEQVLGRTSGYVKPDQYEKFIRTVVEAKTEVCTDSILHYFLVVLGLAAVAVAAWRRPRDV